MPGTTRRVIVVTAWAVYVKPGLSTLVVDPGLTGLPNVAGIDTVRIVCGLGMSGFKDPAAVAGFYSALLGLPVTYRDDDWVVVAASDMSSGLAFQRAPGNLPPTWPDPAVPQQVHLDIMVEDVAAAGARVLTLGAVKLDGENVYADPAGHPFCLIRRPRWAPPIPDDG